MRNREKELISARYMAHRLALLQALGWPDWNESEELDDKMLQTLTSREYNVLFHRFGLDGDPSMSLQDVSERWGELTSANVERVTRERVRKIEADALRKLRKISGYAYPPSPLQGG